MPAVTAGLPSAPAPSTDRHLEVNGVRLHYLDYGGEGKPVMLCLHGGSAHAHWYDFVAGAFTDRFHVLSLDQRGHGDSAWAEPPRYGYPDFVADVHAFAEKLDLRGFVLMGHSMGGMIALQYAAAHQERLAALVLIDSTFIVKPEGIAEMAQRGRHGGRSHDTLEGYLERFRLRPVKTQASAETVRYMGSFSARRFEDGQWRHKLDRRLMGGRSPFDGVALFPKLRIPLLILKAALSKRITPEILAAARAGAPQLEFAEIPASEHHITLDNPAGMLPVLRGFLGRHFR